jgi:hypothetical protein
MHKKVLSELAVYHGTIDMPYGFEIDRERLAQDIVVQNVFKKKDFPFSRSWDMLNTYVMEYSQLRHGIRLKNLKTWGNFYQINQSSPPLKHLNLMKLEESPDFIFLYAVEVIKDSCSIRLVFDDNKNKDRVKDIPLNNNEFIMFPSNYTYYVSPNKSDGLNFIQTITYEKQ